MSARKGSTRITSPSDNTADGAVICAPRAGNPSSRVNGSRAHPSASSEIDPRSPLSRPTSAALEDRPVTTATVQVSSRSGGGVNSASWSRQESMLSKCVSGPRYP